MFQSREQCQHYENMANAAQAVKTRGDMTNFIRSLNVDRLSQPLIKHPYNPPYMENDPAQTVSLHDSFSFSLSVIILLAAFPFHQWFDLKIFVSYSLITPNRAKTSPDSPEPDSIICCTQHMYSQTTDYVPSGKDDSKYLKSSKITSRQAGSKKLFVKLYVL